MRPTLALVFSSLLATSVAHADVEVGTRPPDATATADDGGGTNGGASGGGCAASPGAAEGAGVFVVLGVAAFVLRRRRARDGDVRA